MANKRIDFTIGTKLDRAGLVELQNALNILKKTTAEDIVFQINSHSLADAKKEIQYLYDSVDRVNKAFSNAFNADLGTVNINKLQRALQNIDLAKVQKSWSLAGTAGESAFRKMASAALTANLELKQTDTIISKMKDTFGKTVSWGISSSVFNTMTNAIQKSWDYTKALDKSLNSIRIVSGQSANEMERFAVQANKAAKELGTTTKAYADAALIFYQQGLNEIDVENRTKTVTKMSNVTGEAAEDVSSYMTAIWNNFDDGSKTLEYYADVLTKLGAATASSTDEIAAGLEKFASVSETVGLSYEYATASLATVVAETRQSADVVGTAFKTLFSRIQGLKLGETLEDGTTLNKYSQALQSVGISIKEQDGSLKKMDDILNEMGGKWKTLSRDQQTALAQTVAGVRQYNQLMALMNNWDKVQKNILLTKQAEGTLNEQNEIYLQSYEGHLNQLKAAQEELYETFYDSDSMKEMIDGVTTLVELFNSLVQSIGGGGSALKLLGAIGTQVMSNTLAKTVSTMISNFKVAKDNVNKLNAEYEILQRFKKVKSDDEEYKQLLQYEEQLLQYRKMMTIDEYNEGQGIVSNLSSLYDQADALDLNIQKAEEYIQAIGVGFSNPMDTPNLKNTTTEDGEAFKSEQEYLKANQASLKALQAKREQIKNINKLINKQAESQSKLGRLEEQYGANSAELKEAELKYTEEVSKNLNNILSLKDESLLLTNEEYAAIIQIREARATHEINDTDVTNRLRGVAAQMESDVNHVANVIKKESLGASEQVQNDIGNATDVFNSKIKALKTQAIAEQMINLASAVTQFTSGIQILAGIPAIFKDEDLENGEKFLQIIMATGSGLGAIVSGYIGVANAIPTLITLFTGLSVKEFIAAQGAKTLGGALWTALAPILPIILAVAAAIAVLVGAVYACVQAYNADANAAKNAQKSVEDLTSAYEDCREKAEELKETLGDYEEGVKELEKLDQKTDEFKEKLKSVNEEARALIEKYKLFDNYSYNALGAIVIDPKELERVQAEADAQVKRLKESTESATLIANRANLKSQRTEFARDVGMLGRSQQVTQTLPNGQRVYQNIEGSTHASGERTGESIQLDDNSVKIIAEGLSKIKLETPDKYGDLFADTDTTALRDTILGFGDLTPAVRENIDQVLAQKDALKALTESTYEQIKANDYTSKQILEGVIEDSYANDFKNFATKDGETDTVLSTNLMNAMKGAAGRQDAENEDGLQKKIANIDVSDVKNTGDLQEYEQYKDVKNDVDLIRTYAHEIMGIDWDTINNHVVIDDKTGKGSMTTDTGEVLIQDKNDEQMRRELAAKAERDKIEAKYAEEHKGDNDALAQSLQDLVTDAADFGNSYGTNFTNAMLVSIANGTKELDFSNIFADINPEEYVKLMNMDATALQESMGLTDEELDKLGYGSAEEFKTAFQKGFENWEWDINSAIERSMSKLDSDDMEGFDDDATEDMSEYAKSLMSTAEESDKLADSLKYDSDAAALVSNQVMKMNRGIDNLADGFEDWNSVLKKSSKESQEYADAMGGIKNSLSDILDVSEDYISNDFVAAHLDEIKKASEGSETAIESLRAELSQDIIANLLVYNNMESNKEQVMQEMTNLQTLLDGMEVGKTIDMSMDDTQVIDAMNNIIQQAGLTAEQANQLFSQMGIEPEFEVTKEIQNVSVPEYTTETEVVERGFFGTPTITKTRTYQTGSKVMPQEVEVPALSVNGAPIVKKVTRKANSSFNNYSSSNKGGKSPGKKSGGGSKSDPKKEDALEKELDVYHDINIAIKQVETSLGRLEREQEKLFGGDLIDNLNKQLAELNKQIDNYRTKIGIAKKEQQRMQQELAQKGIAFNADGTIANYAAAYEAQFNYVNSIINKYNSMSAEAQESYQETLDKAKENFEKFVEAIEEYDNLISEEIPGMEDEIQEMINDQIEIQIEKFNMEIEIRLDLEEAQREWNDFKKRIIDGVEEDDILGNVKEDIKNYGIYYDQQGTGIIQKEAEHLYEILDQLKQMDETGTSSYYGDNRAQALEDLKTYTDAIMSSMEELDELIKQIEESYVNLMDEAQEKFDEQIENFEFITENLEHNIQLVELMKGTEQFADVDTFELMNSYYEKQKENYQQQIQFQASQVAFWKEQMDGAEYASDEWESAREKWMAATSELNSLIEASIDNLQTKYLNAIDSIFDKMNKSVTNGLGLDYISEEWDLINKNADQYLDTINRAYGIQQLQDKYLDAIDGTDSLSAQQKLNKLMEQELSALKNKDKLTEYDLERAEKKYEIALKQIALEEAQQNKSQLRLRRDSQGNYRYEYVADDDEVSKLKQEIDSLYNALYNFDLNRYKENLEQAYDMWEEMQSKIYDIYQDTTLSEEQRNQKIALLQEQYGELINGIVAENEVIKLNLQESTYIELNRMYGENISHFEEMTLAQQELVNMLAGDSIAAYEAMSQTQQAIIAELCGFTLAEFTALSDEEQRIYLDLIQGYQNLADSEKDILEGQIVPQWTSGVQNMVDTIAGEGGLFPTCKDAFEQMDKAVEDLSKEMGTVLDDAEKDLTDLTTAQDDTILTTQNMITAMGDLTTAYGNQLAECKKVIDGLHDLQKEYREAEKAAKDMAIAANAYRTQEQKKAANETTVNSPSSNTQPAPAPAPQHRGPQGNGSPDVGDTVTYTGGYYYTSSNGGSKGKRGIGKQVRITQIANGAKYPIHVYSTDSAYGWLKKEQLSGYDTGGYTGEWDNSGRLALLHQKELVLNATDTQNMLAAVEIIRSITDTIGSGMLSRLASLNASAVGFNANNTEAIEQNVHIEANFPNVKDSREIEDALNNLVNTASQRVHTK